jgi:hypothetical protein
MSNEPKDLSQTLSQQATGAKRPWHPPELHEVDLVETQAAGITNVYPADAPTYATT